MTPKQKASELVTTYLNIGYGVIIEYVFNSTELAKQIAIIAVDEIIAANPASPVDLSSNLRFSERVDEAVKYWEQVKTEIINL